MESSCASSIRSADSVTLRYSASTESFSTAVEQKDPPSRFWRLIRKMRKRGTRSQGSKTAVELSIEDLTSANKKALASSYHHPSAVCRISRRLNLTAVTDAYLRHLKRWSKEIGTHLARCSHSVSNGLKLSGRLAWELIYLLTRFSAKLVFHTIRYTSLVVISIVLAGIVPVTAILIWPLDMLEKLLEVCACPKIVISFVHGISMGIALPFEVSFGIFRLLAPNPEGVDQ